MHLLHCLFCFNYKSKSRYYTDIMQADAFSDYLHSVYSQVPIASPSSEAVSAYLLPLLVERPLEWTSPD